MNNLKYSCVNYPTAEVPEVWLNSDQNMAEECNTLQDEAYHKQQSISLWGGNGTKLAMGGLTSAGLGVIAPSCDSTKNNYEMEGDYYWLSILVYFISGGYKTGGIKFIRPGWITISTDT